MAVRKNGLGRGLDALIPGNRALGTPAVKPKEAPEKKLSAAAGEKKAVQEKELSKRVPAVMVKTSRVEPNREQPRKQFNEAALLELSESIKTYGMLQPILVSDRKDYYEIVAGERRWRAAKLAGVKEVPVIIRELTDKEIVEISLIENIQREDLNAIEEAMAYKRLMDEFHMKQEEIADKVSKSRTAVTNSMRLLKLEIQVQQMLIDDMLTAGHARALLALDDPQLQVQTAEQVCEEKLSVRETERLIKKLLEPPKEKSVPQENQEEELLYTHIEERMKDIVGTKVMIHRKRNDKGKIEIEYYSRDELDRIIELFESI